MLSGGNDLVQFLALKCDIWCSSFNIFPENHLTKFCAFYDYKTFQQAKDTLY